MAPEIEPVRDFGANTFDWIMGCTLVYCCMFGIGELVLQSYLTGLFLLVIAAIAGYLIYWSLSRRGWSTFSGATESATLTAAESD
jgi:high-affinity Fe2+/Pb2+ permease